MRVINAPHPFDMKLGEISVFLAGSIEMGKAELWQDKMINQFSDVENVVFLNPRRPDWDNSWLCTKDSPPFREQVEWEQDGLLGVADTVFFYFSPGTVSPISLLELGECLLAHVYLKVPRKLIVVCPEGYSRKGNVDITTERWNLPVYESLNAGIIALKKLCLE